jgi:hypothetical protein
VLDSKSSFLTFIYNKTLGFDFIIASISFVIYFYFMFLQFLHEPRKKNWNQDFHQVRGTDRAPRQDQILNMGLSEL